MIKTLLVGVLLHTAALFAYSANDCKEKLVEAWTEQSRLGAKVWTVRCESMQGLDPDSKVYLGMLLVFMGRNADGEKWINQALGHEKVSAEVEAQLDAFLAGKEREQCEQNIAKLEENLYRSLVAPYSASGYSLSPGYDCEDINSRSRLEECSDRLHSNYSEAKTAIENQRRGLSRFKSELQSRYYALDAGCRSAIGDPSKKAKWSEEYQATESERSRLEENYSYWKGKLSDEDDRVSRKEARKEANRRQEQENAERQQQADAERAKSWSEFNNNIAKSNQSTIDILNQSQEVIADYDRNRAEQKQERQRQERERKELNRQREQEERDQRLAASIREQKEVARREQEEDERRKRRLEEQRREQALLQERQEQERQREVKKREEERQRQQKENARKEEEARKLAESENYCFVPHAITHRSRTERDGGFSGDVITTYIAIENLHEGYVHCGVHKLPGGSGDGGYNLKPHGKMNTYIMSEDYYLSCFGFNKKDQEDNCRKDKFRMRFD